MSEPTTRLTGLSIHAAREQWQVCGLLPAESGQDPIFGGVRLTFQPLDTADITESGAGLVGWTLDRVLSGGEMGLSIDGIPTSVFDPGSEPDSSAPLGIIGIDHVVINTDNLERTSAEVSGVTGCELRRVREVNETMRQGFHKFGDIVIEIVERKDAPPGAALWGIVFNVEDLDKACEWLGPDVVSPPKDAVQAGRRIATIRAIAGLGVPVALMSV